MGDGSEATPMETTSPVKKETKADTAGGGAQRTDRTPSTSGVGIGSLQLPPSEGNVATASAAALAAAAVKAKVRTRERKREREGGRVKERGRG